MFAMISRLRYVDQILVYGFILFAIFVIGCLIYLERERIRTGHIRTLNGMILHLELLINWLRSRSDNEPYDPRWMDYKKWKETRRL